MRLNFAARLLSFVLIAVFALSHFAQAADKDAKPVRILMVTQSAGYKHGSVSRMEDKLAPAEVAMTQLGQQTGLFKVDCTQDCAADLTKDNLKNYDVVMFYTTGNLPIAKEDMDYFLNDWLKQQGHGFIGFHSAADTYKNFEPYWEMIGGTFDGHPWSWKTTVTVSVHDTEFPAMKPFGEEFEFTDEIYQYTHWQPEKVHVLMSLNMAKCNPKKPYQVAVAWAKEWGDGRIFFNNLGHNPTTWTDKRFLKSTEEAIRWVTGQIDGDAMPNPDVSKAQEEKAAADAKAAE